MRLAEKGRFLNDVEGFVWRSTRNAMPQQGRLPSTVGRGHTVIEHNGFCDGWTGKISNGKRTRRYKHEFRQDILQRASALYTHSEWVMKGDGTNIDWTRRRRTYSDNSEAGTDKTQPDELHPDEAQASGTEVSIDERHANDSHMKQKHGESATSKMFENRLGNSDEWISKPMTTARRRTKWRRRRWPRTTQGVIRQDRKGWHASSRAWPWLDTAQVGRRGTQQLDCHTANQSVEQTNRRTECVDDGQNKD